MKYIFFAPNDQKIRGLPSGGLLIFTSDCIRLAIIDPLRSETLAEAGRHILAAINTYAQVKATHLNTAQICRAQGIRFRPMLAESTDAWEIDTSPILLFLSRGAAARKGSDPGALYVGLLQELSVAIRASHTRAVLNRRAAVTASTLDATTRHFALHGAIISRHTWLYLVPELDAFKLCHRPIRFLPYFLRVFLSRASFDLLMPFSGLRIGMNLLPSGCHGSWVVPSTTRIDSQIFPLALGQCHTLGGVCPFSPSSPSSSNFNWTERAM